MRALLRRAVSVSGLLCGMQGNRAREGPEDAAARLAACLPLAQRGRVLLQTPAGAALVVDGVISMAWGSRVRTLFFTGQCARLHAGQPVWRDVLARQTVPKCSTTPPGPTATPPPPPPPPPGASQLMACQVPAMLS